LLKLAQSQKAAGSWANYDVIFMNSDPLKPSSSLAEQGAQALLLLYSQEFSPLEESMEICMAWPRRHHISHSDRECWRMKIRGFVFPAEKERDLSLPSESYLLAERINP
jgi:hypothetical protein